VFEHLANDAMPALIDRLAVGKGMAAISQHWTNITAI
jgi:hypothetical protein